MASHAAKLPDTTKRWAPGRDGLTAHGYDWDTRAGNIGDAYRKWKAANPERANFYELFGRVSKRELYEAALHLSALAHESGSYDVAMENGDAERRLIEELRAVAQSNGRKTKA